MPAAPTVAEVDVIVTIRPQPRSIIPGMHRLMVRYGPLRLVSIMRSHSSSGWPAISRRAHVPAAFTRISIRWSAASASAKNASTDPTEHTSSGPTNTRTPRAAISPFAASRSFSNRQVSVLVREGVWRSAGEKRAYRHVGTRPCQSNSRCAPDAACSARHPGDAPRGGIGLLPSILPPGQPAWPRERPG